MSCLTLEPRFGHGQPLWLSRHIDFHTSCLLCTFAKFQWGIRQGVPQFVKSICRTVVILWCAHCPKCRTVVSLSRSIQVAGPRPPKSGFGPLSPEYRLSIYSLYVDGALWAPGAPQGFLEVPGPVWAAWAAWGCLGLSWALLGVLLGLPGQPLWLPGALGPDLDCWSLWLSAA